jgi:hypothetical protein
MLLMPPKGTLALSITLYLTMHVYPMLIANGSVGPWSCHPPIKSFTRFFNNASLFLIIHLVPHTSMLLERDEGASDKGTKNGDRTL